MSSEGERLQLSIPVQLTAGDPSMRGVGKKTTSQDVPSSAFFLYITSLTRTQEASENKHLPIFLCNTLHLYNKRKIYTGDISSFS